MLNGMFDSSGKAPGATCSTAGVCVTNAMCSTTCTCNTGYTATPTTTPTSCESEYTYMK
jgi:hypothetical protein